MKKRKKPQTEIAQLKARELQLIMKISFEMETLVRNFDYHSSVRTMLKKLKKRHFGIQVFLVSNILNFSPGYWYKPEELKRRFETHMNFKISKNTIDGDFLEGKSKSISSREVNNALKQLQKKFAFKNITQRSKMKKVVQRRLKFEGYPSVWDFPDTSNLVKSILEKETTFKVVYLSLLKSGLLYHYWTCYFLTNLGCLEEMNPKDIESTEQILSNMYASAPEKIKNKVSPELYSQRLVALRDAVLKLDDVGLVKNAGKMAGYIIKNYPEISVFGIHQIN